jgi:ElaB/YqjD/DUF883 family membrane-anchored ribosome-binding protein
MDLNKLRTLVFEKTGLKVDTDDPIFALVALNEAVLAECVHEHVAQMHDATEKLTVQTNQLLAAGEHYNKLLQQIGQVIATGSAQDVAIAIAAESKPVSAGSAMEFGKQIPWRFVAAAGGVALLTAVLTISGQRAFGHGKPPAVAPTPVVAAPVIPALTPEQIQLIQNGEKFNTMWPKLDAKTQAKIEAALKQP